MAHKEALTNVDTAWLRMDTPSNLMMISGVMMFEAPLDRKALRSVLERRFLCFDRFRQRVNDRDSSPYWEEDPHFNLDNHLHRVALPAPGDQETLQAFVSDLMSTPLNFARPLWDLHLVENFGNGCAVIVRIHHCIADGIALIRVLLSMTDSEPTPTESVVPSPLRDASSDRSSGVARLLKSVTATAGDFVAGSLDLVRNPGLIFDRARQGVNLAAVIAKLGLMGSDSLTQFKGDLGVRKCAAWTEPMPLNDVKQIGKAMGGTVNDVLMTAAAGALRRYLITHRQPVDGVEIRAIVPVNLRPIKEPPRLGNHFGLVFLSLPVGVEDPSHRMRLVRKRMDVIKGSMEAVVAIGILHAIGMAPPILQKQVVKRFSVMASAVLTNVPGPREQLYLAGIPLGRIMFWVPRAGAVGMGISILSYNGEVLMGFATDAGLVPDPQALTSALKAEYEALREAVAL